MNEQIFSKINLNSLISENPSFSFEFLNRENQLDYKWQSVFNNLASKSNRLSSSPGYLNKLLVESGVTFNLYKDNYSVSRPWNLDPIPLIYSEQDWSILSRGLEQRALVWDLFLKDIYGEKRIVSEGVIPDEIIFNNQSYLRPCHNLGLKNSFGIFNYSADVVRDSNGEFKVVGDKAQNPFGIGYTLENRLALSRVYESTFNECNVKRLAGFFRTLSDNLYLQGSTLDRNPNIVILTPGPFNEGFYEHNLLSRYLGFTLARGSDLTVRDGLVYLKAIEGLKRVHVIYRRQLDIFCDPLELRADSLLGIPGLVHANRLGNVKVVSSLGSGIINDHIFLHFYERICQYYLGESPKVKSTNTLWLKEPEQLSAFQNNPGNHTLYEVLNGASEIIDLKKLNSEEYDKLLSKIAKRPQNYIAIPSIETKKVPSWINDKVELTSYKLRTFLCRDNDNFKILDGALCLASQENDPSSISIQSAQISKDTWVLSENQVPFVTLINNKLIDLPIKRSSSDMPSSMIDNILWLSIYMERTEGLLRIMNYLYNSLINVTGYELDVLNKLYFCINHSAKEETKLSESHLEALLQPILTNHSDPNSLCFLIDKALENAAVRRNRISLDTWKLLSNLKNTVLEQPENMTRFEASQFISKLLNLVSAFHGLCNENMSREAAWRFLDAGKRIERIGYISKMLKVFLSIYKSEESEINALKVLLEVTDCSMTYNSRYVASLQLIPVVDLLIADDTNPRSIYFQLLRLEEHFNILPGNLQYPKNPEQQIISQALNDFHQIDFKALLALNKYNIRKRFILYLDSLSEQLDELSESINRTYLSHIHNKAKVTYSEI
ncbi:MAG: circularly permuted type 2 ATP-grasp protein [Lentisphaeraceae bacterium]|nr:circularly permuted type 2 ATP-grasp protein [Lentisphaeraceae bacterium]